MNVEEFIPEEQAGEQPDDLDVQKAVVESLAADKAEQDEKIDILKTRLDELLKEKGELKIANAALKAELESNQGKMAEMKTALENVGDVLAKNSESPASSQVALLERDPDLADRFAGETRDQVLEVIREARDAAEKEGRVRRAQILESVLVANEPTGNLEKKRAALEKFFADNGNILTGPVIAELEKCGISHKKGEEYLLPSEILKRTY